MSSNDISPKDSYHGRIHDRYFVRINAANLFAATLIAHRAVAASIMRMVVFIKAGHCEMFHLKYLRLIRLLRQILAKFGEDVDSKTTFAAGGDCLAKSVISGGLRRHVFQYD